MGRFALPDPALSLEGVPWCWMLQGRGHLRWLGDGLEHASTACKAFLPSLSDHCKSQAGPKEAQPSSCKG